MALNHFDEAGFQEALDSGKLMLVDFWAPWCGPCRMLGPVIEQLAEEYEDKDVIIGKVNTDENLELTRKYGIVNIPTVIFFKNGQEFDRKVGGMSIDDYADVLDGNL